MEKDYLTYQIDSEENILNYAVFGTGPKALFAFHGLGQQHFLFHSFEKIFSEYTIYSFDLFFHGKSKWNKKDKPISKETWKTLVEKLMEKHAINEFSVTAFSIGGKFAVTTIELFPKQVRAAFLIAPDGLKINFWYKLATGFILTRQLFKFFITNSHSFYRFANFLKKIGLVKKSMIRFAKSQMNSSLKRKRVYYSWTVFRKMNVQPSNLIQLINQYNICFFLSIGKYDKIIPPSSVESFIKKIKNNHFVVLECGHNHLIEHTLNYLEYKNLLINFSYFTKATNQQNI